MATTNGTTRQQKAEQIAAAWEEYRAASRAIPVSLPYSGHKRAGEFREGFLEIDERLWRRYREAERAILAEPSAQKAA